MHGPTTTAPNGSPGVKGSRSGMNGAALSIGRWTLSTPISMARSGKPEPTYAKRVGSWMRRWTASLNPKVRKKDSA